MDVLGSQPPPRKNHLWQCWYHALEALTSFCIKKSQESELHVPTRLNTRLSKLSQGAICNGPLLNLLSRVCSCGYMQFTLLTLFDAELWQTDRHRCYLAITNSNLSCDNLSLLWFIDWSTSWSAVTCYVFQIKIFAGRSCRSNWWDD